VQDENWWKTKISLMKDKKSSNENDDNAMVHERLAKKTKISLMKDKKSSNENGDSAIVYSASSLWVLQKKSRLSAVSMLIFITTHY